MDQGIPKENLKPKVSVLRRSIVRDKLTGVLDL